MLNNKKKYTWQQNCIVLAILCCTLSIFYYSWLPDSRLGEETYLPSRLLVWSNLHFNLRTAVPFFALSFLLEVWYSISGPAARKIKIPFWVFNITVAVVLVCLVEGGQFFIANRHPDRIDVFFGFVGSVLGCVWYAFFNFISELIFIKNEK